VTGQQHVLEHGHAGEKLDVLEGPAYAQRRELVGMEACDAAPIE
jgi:hypothetical protein